MNAKTEIAQRNADGAEAATLFPPVDVIEDEGGITLTADLPGVAKENLTIRVEVNKLTLEAPLSLGESRQLASVYAEVRAAHFQRSFTLSRELDSSKIDAALRDGVLKLHVPKLEHAKPRRIEVRVG